MTMSKELNEANKKKSKISITLGELIQNTNALRKTQNPVKRLSISSIKPVIKSKDLYISGQALGLTQSKLHQVGIRLLGVSYSETRDRKHSLPINLGHGNQMFMSQVDLSNKAMVRCSCLDYYFMWHYWNNKEKALMGRLPKKYVRKTDHYPERNPTKTPGLCKHLLKMLEELQKLGVIAR